MKLAARYRPPRSLSLTLMPWLKAPDMKTNIIAIPGGFGGEPVTNAIAVPVRLDGSQGNSPLTDRVIAGIGLWIASIASAPLLGAVMRLIYGDKHVAPALLPRLA